MKTLLAVSLINCLFSVLIYAQPKPGDIFREYVWTTSYDGELFLRVGGRLDYQSTPQKFDGKLDDEGYLHFPAQLDLQNVVKAEVTLEKVLSHEDTKGLRISWNQYPSTEIPESPHIPEPQSEYYHHFYPSIQLPLSQLKEKNNRFKLEVDSIQDWNWPQNLIYGVILRLYYQDTPEHLLGNLVLEGKEITEKTTLTFSTDHPEKVNKVHFIGKYTGINYEGDGLYDQWHYHYYRGNLQHHIGTAMQSNFTTTWNTSWVPDQEKPIALSAWVADASGLTHFLPAVSGLKMNRDFQVELCKPFDQPQRWVTRAGRHQQKVNIKGDLTKAKKAKLIWTSWSPGYMNGLYVNDFLVYIRNKPRYVYMPMEINISEMYVFQAGENTISTGKTPLYHGEMVHGMEVQWPGIMVLIRYEQ